MWVKFVYCDIVLLFILNICYIKNDNVKLEMYLIVSIYMFLVKLIEFFLIIIIRINKNEIFENIMIIMLWINCKILISNININKNCLYFFRVVCWVVYYLGCVRYFWLLYMCVFEFFCYIICKIIIWNFIYLKEIGLYKFIVSISLC